MIFVCCSYINNPTKIFSWFLESLKLISENHDYFALFFASLTTLNIFLSCSLFMVSSTVLNSSEFAAAKSLQSCLTLCDSRDRSQPGSPVPWILQARTLEWVAMSFSNAWKSKVKGKSFTRVRLFATPWTAAYQAPLSMGVSRQEYWSIGCHSRTSFTC